MRALSQLLVNNVAHGSNTVMATGKLLLLMATAVNGKPKKYQQLLTERISVTKNLLNCYFQLIKSDGKRIMLHDLIIV